MDPVPDVQAGTRDLKLVVQRGLEIAGRLDWGAGRRPEGLQVEVRSGRSKAFATVGEDGGFRCEGLRPGTYVVRVVADVPAIKIERTAEAGTRDLAIAIR